MMRADAESTVSVTRNTLWVIHPVENTGKDQEGNNAGEKSCILSDVQQMEPPPPPNNSPN